jgi:L-ascorbate metabolism protein UlaG (beta-lactamase superfamily)
MRLTYLGHSTFLLSENSVNVIIDPFLSGNPQRENLDFQTKIDYILVSHGHPDHIGDTISLAKKYGSKVISIFEIVNFLNSKGVNDTIPMNIGGKVEFEFGFVKMVAAIHSSSIIDSGQTFYGGVPAGFVINFYGKIVYFAGDTALTYDMKIIGDMYDVDVALLPIGGHFTMDTEEALIAVDFIKPDIVIPMHYNTWPPISADAENFIKRCKEKGVKGVKLNVNEWFEL